MAKRRRSAFVRRPLPRSRIGSLLALRLGLYEEDVLGVYAGGGLVGFQSVLASPFLYLPYDVIIPGALTAGDLSVLTAGLAPRLLALVGFVDGLNRAVDRKTAEAAYEQTSRAYRAANVRDRLVVAGAEARSVAFVSVEGQVIVKCSADLRCLEVCGLLTRIPGTPSAADFLRRESLRYLPT